MKLNSDGSMSMGPGGLISDTVAEETADSGVTVDELLIKDGAHAQITGTDDLHTEYQKETDFTAGSVLFRGSSVIAEDNADFFWDATNKRLGIANSGAPQYRLDVGNLSYFAVNGNFAHIVQHNNAATTFWSIAPRNSGDLDIAVTTTDPRPTSGTIPTSGNALSIKPDKTVQLKGDLDHDGGNVGFYAAAPVAQQTGVAVTAAAIHAALVNLGLITA